MTCCQTSAARSARVVARPNRAGGGGGGREGIRSFHVEEQCTTNVTSVNFDTHAGRQRATHAALRGSSSAIPASAGGGGGGPGPRPGAVRWHVRGRGTELLQGHSFGFLRGGARSIKPLVCGAAPEDRVRAVRTRSVHGVRGSTIKKKQRSAGTPPPPPRGARFKAAAGQSPPPSPCSGSSAAGGSPSGAPSPWRTKRGGRRS